MDSLPAFHPHRPRLVAPVRQDPTGVSGPTRKQTRSSQWRRTSRGLYVPATVDRSPAQRIVETAARMPRDGAVTGWAALHWYGARWFDGLTPDGRDELPVPVVSPVRDIRRDGSFALSEERLDPAETVEHDGLRVVVPVRAVFFEMRYAASLRDAVTVLDMAAYDDLVSIEEQAAYTLAHPGWTGVPQAREALPLADENSWSPWESRTRLIWTQVAGLPPPLCNRPLFDAAGRLIGTPDLLDPEAGLVVEYDGSLHLAQARRARDLSREHGLRSHGLDCLVVVAEHMSAPERLARHMLEARARSTRSRHPRSWTLDEPSWWQPSYTVEQRRSLTGRARRAVNRLRRRAS